MPHFTIKESGFRPFPIPSSDSLNLNVASAVELGPISGKGDVPLFETAGQVMQMKYSANELGALVNVKGKLTKLVFQSITIPRGYVAISIARAGTLVLKHPERFCICQPGEVACFVGPTEIRILFGRGEIGRDLFVLPRAKVAEIIDLAIAEGSMSSAETSHYSTLKGIREATGLLDDPKICDAQRNSLSLRHLMMVAGCLSTGGDCNAMTISDNQDALSNLLREIDGNPSAPWKLKDAADIAGYSLFHFCRWFRAQMGCGLPEYVNSVRSVALLKAVMDSDQELSVLMDEYGYSLAQGRHALRQRFGLLPKELRQFRKWCSF